MNPAEPRAGARRRGDRNPGPSNGEDGNLVLMDLGISGRATSRTATSQRRMSRGPARRRQRLAGIPSGAPGEALELGPALGLERLPALAGLLGAVEEQVRVVGQLLDTGHAVFGRVEAGLHQPQRER